MLTKLKNLLRDYVTVALATAAILALLGAGLTIVLLRGTAPERAAAELEDRGYTVVSAERKWISVKCLHKDDAHVVVRVASDGVEKDIDTCVSFWRVRVRD